MTVVALDAMGGDLVPRSTVEGALRAAEQGIEVTLVGDAEALNRELERHGGDTLWRAGRARAGHDRDVRACLAGDSQASRVIDLHGDGAGEAQRGRRLRLAGQYRSGALPRAGGAGAASPASSVQRPRRDHSAVARTDTAARRGGERGVTALAPRAIRTARRGVHARGGGRGGPRRRAAEPRRGIDKRDRSSRSRLTRASVRVRLSPGCASSATWRAGISSAATST